MSTPEGKVKAKVKKARLRLIDEGFKVWSFMPVQMGYGAPGLDFFWCVNGFWVSIETKVKGKKMTPRQEQTADEIRNADGLVFVVDDDESLEYALSEIRKLCKQT